MSGETDLTRLLRALTPIRNPGVFVYCTVPSLLNQDMTEVIGMFRETEGITLILPRSAADAQGLPYLYTAAWITLTVHSSLSAVGLTAAFAQALAEVGISCNVVAGAYHDHLFVAEADADNAVAVLERLSGTNR